MKREVNLDVKGQEIHLDKHGSIIRGTKGYLQCKFSFSEEWKELKKVAVFSNTYKFEKEHAVPILKGSCQIPDEVTDGRRIYIKVVGRNAGAAMTTRACALDQEG